LSRTGSEKSDFTFSKDQILPEYYLKIPTLVTWLRSSESTFVIGFLKMLLLFQLLALVFCKDLQREECINPESVKLDDLFCSDVWKEEARMAISGGLK
jgi:hypothetical protein